MKNGYALLKACMEDKPEQVAPLFAQAITERVGTIYENLEKVVGREIGRGSAFDAATYDALISEAVSGGSGLVADYAAPGEVEPNEDEAEDLVGLDGEPPLGSSGSVKSPPPSYDGRPVG